MSRVRPTKIHLFGDVVNPSHPPQARLVSASPLSNRRIMPGDVNHRSALFTPADANAATRASFCPTAQVIQAAVTVMLLRTTRRRGCGASGASCTETAVGKRRSRRGSRRGAADLFQRLPSYPLARRWPRSFIKKEAHQAASSIGLNAPGSSISRRRTVQQGDRIFHTLPSGYSRPKDMCRNIKPLFNFDPPTTDVEIRNASIQFVRKISGFSKPSRAIEAAVNRAVTEVAAVARHLLDSLVTDAEPRNREVEAAC